jgi:Transposase
MKQRVSEVFAAFVGLDWADAPHDVCLQAAGTEQREFLSLEHSPEEIHAWVQTLRTRFHGQPVAVCLERTKGPIVSALRHDDFLVRFPVNPLTVAQYREALTPSRATDDPTDAALQVEILCKLGVGRSAPPMMNPSISKRSNATTHHSCTTWRIGRVPLRCG